MHAQLPLDVIQLIILYIPFTRLRLLCEEDDSLKSLIAPILYRYVSIGDFKAYTRHRHGTSKFHNITFVELDQLISGTIDAKVQHLKIKEVSRRYIKKFLETARHSSEFFSKIPIIDYEGSCFSQCMKVLPTQSFRHVSINRRSRLEIIKTNPLPPNITTLSIIDDYVENENVEIPRLPTSLKHLKLDCFTWRNLVFKFPPHLELFSIGIDTFSDKLPEGLLKFETHGMDDDVILPDSLVELKVSMIHIMFTFPSGLKKLKISGIVTGIADLVKIKFPCNLEVLDLADADVTMLEGIVLPSLLRELRLEANMEANKLESLDNIMFPNLELLNISSFRKNGALKSLSKVHFPKLEYLLAWGQPIEDWSVISLPETLKTLEMNLMGEPRTLKFPLHLRVLKIRFMNNLAEYCELKLPDTLQELVLSGGISSIFDWNLPQLQSMNIFGFSGPIKVPESVVDLSLQYKNHELREEIHIPPNVEKLEIPYPLEEYPATVTHLRIHYSEVKSFPLPPNVESVSVTQGILDGSLLTVPNSLNYFNGSFDKGMKRPSNWDADNEYYSQVTIRHPHEEPTQLVRG